MAEEKVSKSSSEKMDKNLQGALMWLLAPITSLIWMNESDKLVKFHAKQSLYYGIFSLVMNLLITPGITIISFGLLFCVPIIWACIDIGIRIYMVVKMNAGEMTKLPVFGDMAEKNK